MPQDVRNRGEVLCLQPLEGGNGMTQVPPQVIHGQAEEVVALNEVADNVEDVRKEGSRKIFGNLAYVPCTAFFLRPYEFIMISQTAFHSSILPPGQSRRVQRLDRAKISTKLIVEELKKCGKRKDFGRGKLLHSQAVDCGSHTDRFVASGLISMYSKCGKLQQAQEVFNVMNHRDAVTWTALINGYVENGEVLAALELFNKMDCLPDQITFVTAAKACGCLMAGGKVDRNSCIDKAVRIHKRARAFGFDTDTIVSNSLILMYSKCGDMQGAQDVFDATLRRDVETWNALMLGYLENGESIASISVFETLDCEPNSWTFVIAIKACKALLTGKLKHSRETIFQKGVWIHSRARECALEKDPVVASSLVEMYGKLGDVPQARRVFDGVTLRDAVLWTGLILAYVENGEASLALELFDKMDSSLDRVTYIAALKACTALAGEKTHERRFCLKKGESIHRKIRQLGLDKDMAVSNTLLSMYGKCGDMQQARCVFDGMMNRDVVTWTALILGYVDNEEFAEALEVFSSLDCTQDSVVFVAAVKACGGLAYHKKLEKETCLEKGADIHRRASELGFDKDLAFSNTLMDMYGKCGDMVRARSIFEGMKDRDVVSWNVLLLGYVENDKSSLVLDLVNSMDCSPDRVTFVAVLKACGNMGALDTGQRIHDRVCELGWEQDEMVGVSLLDFYGKCGKMSAAEAVFNRMHSHSVVTWSALIAGYSSVGDTEGVFRLVKRMEECGVQMNGVTMLLVLSACSHAGELVEGKARFDKDKVYQTVDCYTSMIDMLGRANRLDEALKLIREMPCKPNSVVWTTLLGACKKWSNLEVGKVAFDALVGLENDAEGFAVACVLMRSIYESQGMSSTVHKG